MWFYVQTDYKSKWLPIKYSKQNERELKDSGYVRATMLRVNQVIDEGTNRRDIAYAGPFYIDLDAKDLNDSIASARLLHASLLEKGVPASILQWSLSGAKGLHLIIHEKCFSSGRAINDLPKVYSEMAYEMMTFGVDFGVYSGGKGVIWRIHNVEREDKAFRVRITAEELMDLTEDGYRRLVSAPRDITIPDQVITCPYLISLYERARVKARRAGNNKPQSTVTDEALEPFKEEPPRCIEKLMSGKVSTTASFHDVALQTGIFIAHAGCTETLIGKVTNSVAENCASHTYSSIRHRFSHLESTIGFVKGNQSRYTFSCAAMRGVVDGHPCATCPLMDGVGEGEEAPDYVDLLSRHQLAVDAQGIWNIRGGNRSPLTTFTLAPMTIFKSEQGVREGVEMSVTTGSGETRMSMFGEEDWDSRKGLLRHTHGLNGAAFFGGETSIQAIKHITLNNPTIYDADVVTTTEAAGILMDSSSGTMEAVFIEPGYSVNRYGVTGTHMVAGEGEHVPKPHTSIRTMQNPQRGCKDTADALINLLKMNSPEIAGQVAGWVSVCILRAHIMVSFAEFPVMGLWGAAESGKSITARAFTTLAGLDYRADPPLSASNTTRWPILDLLRSTRTSPRILEEMNLTGSRMDRRMIGVVTEAVKNTWDGTSIARGYVKKAIGTNVNAGTLSFPMVAPVMFISEQEITIPAIRQRAVQIQMTKQSRVGRKVFMDRSYRDPAAKQLLMRFSKASVNYALRLSVEDVVEMVNKNAAKVEGGLEDRALHSYACVLTGLEFLAYTAQQMQLGEGVQNEVKVLSDAVCKMVGTKDNVVARTKEVTEVDKMLDVIILWYSYKLAEGSQGAVTARRLVQAGHSFIDMQLPAALYIVLKEGGPMANVLAIRDPGTAMQLIKTEDYYLGEGPQGPSWVRLDNQKLVDRGHDLLVRPLANQ